MQVRYVIRPKGIFSTPNRLAQALGAQTRLVRDDYRYSANDFFLAYPQYIVTEASCFSRVNKHLQRRILEPSVPVPLTKGLPLWPAGDAVDGPFVVRPLRHTQGQDYRLTDDPTDYNPATHYLSKLFPKKWEYRVIYCLGSPVLTLFKRVPESLSPSLPWNHANGSSFITVNNTENNRLRHTDVYERLGVSPVVRDAHLVAADILLARNLSWCVTELNFCPSLSIPANISKVASHVLNFSN